MRRLSTVLALLLASIVAACGSDDEPVETGAGAAVEGEYVAVEITVGGEPRPLVDGTELTLRLMDGQLGASAGCNSIAGAYEIVDGELRVEALSMTEMGCDPPRHDQDEWVADLLSSGPTVEPQAQGLVLRTGATVVGFVDRSVVEPDRDLVGTRWELTGFVRGGGPDGVASDAGGLEAEVTFQEDGTATGFDGCRAFGMGQGDGSPGYVVEGDTISYSGGIDADGAACPDLAEQVEDVRAVLTGTVVWEVDGDRLTLRTSDGSGATFRAAGG